MIPSSAVVDASVALKWLLPEVLSDRAIALQSAILYAPDFLLTECANALWVRTRRGLMTGRDAEEGLAELSALPLTLMATSVLNASALSLSLELGHPIYDCLYLALAEQLEIPLVTADNRLLAAIGRVPRLAGRVTALADLT